MWNQASLPVDQEKRPAEVEEFLIVSQLRTLLFDLKSSHNINTLYVSKLHSVKMLIKLHQQLDVGNNIFKEPDILSKRKVVGLL